MSGEKFQSENSGSVVLVVRFQGRRVVAEESHLKFDQPNLIPGEIKKILELVKRALAAFSLERMPNEHLVFEIRPHVARPDSGSDQEWMASIETSKPLDSKVKTELHALACHTLSQITHGTRELFSVAITDAQSQRFDGQSCIDEPIEKFLNANGGKPLQQTFSVSANLNEQNPIIVSGNVAEPEPRQFEPEDISGAGAVDGFRASRNEVFLMPILNHRAVGKVLVYSCTDSQVFAVLARAFLDRKAVSYRAETRLKPNGIGTMQVVTEAVVVKEEFQLEP